RRAARAAQFADQSGLQALTTAPGEAANGQVLELRLRPHPTAQGLYTADVALRRDGTVLDAALANVVLPAPLDPACFAPSTGQTALGPAGAGGDAARGEPDGGGVADNMPANAGASPPVSEVLTIPDLAGMCVGLSPQPDGTCLEPGDAFQECEACPELLVVPPGTVTVGSPEDEPHRTADEGPQTEIGVATPFAMARHEITRDQFAVFVEHSGHAVGDHCWIWQGAWLKQPGLSFKRPGVAQKGDHPALCVSWDDAQAYVNWLNAGLGLSAEHGYRLPSEAQWEYAARAGASGRGYDRNIQAARIARFRVDGNLLAKTSTSPAASKPANAFGLQDMLGNAWEWTQDCWLDTLEDMPKDASAREFDDCPHRTLRGGSWNDRIEHIRLAARSRTEPDTHSNDVGFRVLRPLFLHPMTDEDTAVTTTTVKE
ncbi:MAG: formylglycine-generating enzyme family protein, partial [Pseudomonadota bacterium]